VTAFIDEASALLLQECMAFICFLLMIRYSTSTKLATEYWRPLLSRSYRLSTGHETRRPNTTTAWIVGLQHTFAKFGRVKHGVVTLLIISTAISGNIRTCRSYLTSQCHAAFLMGPDGDRYQTQRQLWRILIVPQPVWSGSYGVPVADLRLYGTAKERTQHA
jgi:hypothetical protein